MGNPKFWSIFICFLLACNTCRCNEYTEDEDPEGAHDYEILQYARSCVSDKEASEWQRIRDKSLFYSAMSIIGVASAFLTKQYMYKDVATLTAAADAIKTHFQDPLADKLKTLATAGSAALTAIGSVMLGRQGYNALAQSNKDEGHEEAIDSVRQAINLDLEITD